MTNCILGTPYRFRTVETRQHKSGGFSAFSNAQLPEQMGYHTLHSELCDSEDKAIAAMKNGIDLWWTMNGDRVQRIIEKETVKHG